MLVHHLIAGANREAAFVCPMCDGTCPCLRHGGGNKMEKHKAAGWVAVTGRRDPSCGTPYVKWVKDDAVLAKLLAPHLEGRDVTDLPPGDPGLASWRCR
jgi:hypothetical protein